MGLLFTLGDNPLNNIPGRGRPHLKVLAWVIPYSKGRFDAAFSLGVIPKLNVPLLLHFGGCWQGKVPPKIARIGHSILRDPTGTSNTVFIPRIIPLNKRHSIE